jgi:hypothetical protein
LAFCRNIGNAGAWTHQRGTDEHGCEFVPVAGYFSIPSQNALVPLAVEYISAQRQENILLYTLSGFYTYKYVGLFSSIISYLYFVEKTDT